MSVRASQLGGRNIAFYRTNMSLLLIDITRQFSDNMELSDLFVLPIEHALCVVVYDAVLNKVDEDLFRHPNQNGAISVA